VTAAVSEQAKMILPFMNLLVLTTVAAMVRYMVTATQSILIYVSNVLLTCAVIA